MHCFTYFFDSKHSRYLFVEELLLFPIYLSISFESYLSVLFLFFMLETFFKSLSLIAHFYLGVMK